MFPIILLALGAVGAFALYRRHQQALAQQSYQWNTQAGPMTSHGVNLDSAGPFNTGFLGSIYEGASFTLSSTRWPIALGPAIPNQPIGSIAVSVTGPPSIVGVIGCMADPTGRTISLCAYIPEPGGTGTLPNAALPAGLYQGDFLTPLGERGSFSFVVAPGVNPGTYASQP